MAFAPIFLAASALLPATTHQVALQRVARVAIEGAEVPAYDRMTNCAFVAAGPAVAVVHLGDGSNPVLLRTLPAAAAAFPGPLLGEVSHVAVDPAGRGILAVAVIPAERARVPGAVLFYSTRSGALLGRATAGYGPDACEFSADGAFLVVANEGEPAIDPSGCGDPVDPVGSLCVFDLRPVRDAGSIAALRGGDPLAIGGPVLAAARSGLRVAPWHAASAPLDLEPESLAVADGRAYVTLQENDAIAVFALDPPRLERIAPLGTIEQLLDASDRDGGVHLDDRVPCLLLPDQIAAVRLAAEPGGGERLFLLTANEGDVRADVGESRSPLADRARVGELARRNRLAPEALAALDVSDAGLGRLQVCAWSGDLDGDGRIEAPAALGARSVSVFDAETLARVGDTGSAFELAFAERAPAWFNADVDPGVPERPDARSDDRGPEPEGVRAGRVGGRALAFVTLERPGAIAVLDLTDPARPELVGFLAAAEAGDLLPEGLAFVPEEAAPLGRPLLLVAFEGSGSLCVYEVD